MLKSIELCGFKSFADRTRLDLEDGVCALVGPNGSGKSNVVDAVKWALGEQSAKRLRGDDMTDVVFNGSASRAPMGSAEVTLTFDNSSRALKLDVDEIRLTRRVYRDGESEYLVNGQTSRLKDFRDLLGGAGLGSQGYAVIEQGRVEALLQSSSVQRRAVLEEAAGVSRFNAKKQEVARRLERVEQNLLRLSDVVGEIENQLRKTKAQAGKAEQYRALSARLRKLRLEVGLYEWLRKNEELEKLGPGPAGSSEFEAERLAKIQAAEAEVAKLDEKIADFEKREREIDAELAGIRERVASQGSLVDGQIARVGEWRVDANQCAARAREARAKTIADLDGAKKDREELDELRRAVEAIKADFEKESAASAEMEARAEQLARDRDAIQTELREKDADASRFAGELAALESRRASLIKANEERRARLVETTRERDALAQETLRRKTESTKLEEQRTATLGKLNELKKSREKLRRELGARQVEFSDLERKRTAFDERSTLLRDLLRKYEGLAPGAREVLNAMRDPKSPFRVAYGLVADLIRATPEAAPLVELALGQTAQYVVVPSDPELFKHIEQNAANFSGRVGFIWLDPNPNASIPLDPRLDKAEGVLGRADQFVETDPEFAALVQRLLYRTWIVESLDVAKRLYREKIGDSINYLAADGSMLASDGALVVGPSQGSAGLISRRSELASLATETQKLEADFARLNDAVAQLKKRLADADTRFEAEAGVQRETAKELEDARLRQTAIVERETQTTAALSRLGKEIEDAAGEVEIVAKELEEKLKAKENFETRRKELKKRDEELLALIEGLADEREEKAKRSTALKVELAKAEERIRFLADRARRLDETVKENERQARDNESRAKELEERVVRTELAALNAESEVAALFSQKETAAAARAAVAADRAGLDKAKAKANFDLRALRDALERTREQNLSQTTARDRLALEIKAIEERALEDYGVDLAKLERRLEGIDAPEEPDIPVTTKLKALRAVADSKFKKDESETPALEENQELVVPTEPAGAKRRKKEIDEIRAKLRGLGAVNMEAIQALEELKTRYATLFKQYNDLIASRKAIRKIVDRVNADCRRLFEETFEAVRAHFCNIFQKLFGGGKADLALEDPSKPLESGVDIIARPPGKELKSLSLMSGGEKSLTCVALLLAIFKYRTSPICILDEVDAALDEGNVGRFSDALMDFVPDTQFLLVTHSKKTMSSAKAIYGVTMEDSGVSKILSVRFDDVGEDGEILVEKGAAARGPRLMREGAA